MKTLTRSARFVSAAFLFGALFNANGAITDLANAPLITSPTSSVLPNVFLMMDDSGSMAWDYMPDAANFSNTKYGAASSQCNGVFYDPNITYDPPVDYLGGLYSNSSFTGAWNNGYSTGAGTTNLSNNFPVGNVAAFYYKYTGTQTTEKLKDYYNTSSTFYRECNSTVGSTPGSAVFTRVTVSSTSGPGNTDERTNFANWWSYYRTRILMMKTATGRAFNSIGPTFRVGFATINNNNNNDLLALSQFDSTQKSAWYTKLYAVTANNSTPLREALADVGRMYAHKLPSTNANNALTSSLADPMQYSCQQNFTILTTDGFWNGSTTYDLAGNTVGNQDYFEPRAMYDGSSNSTTTTVPYTTVQQRQKVVTGATTTNTFGRTDVTIGNTCTQPGITVGHTVSAYMFDHRNIALGLSASDPDPGNTGRCFNLANNAWLCRGGGSSNPVVNQSAVTDSSGMTWSLVDSFSGNTGCVSDRSIWGSNYSSSMGACQSRPGVSGRYVITTPYTQIETLAGQTTTIIDEYTANQQTTQTTTNGVVGATSALTPASPTYSFTTNISTNSTPVLTDTFGAWTAGTATSVCTATAALPSPSSTASVPPYTTSTTGGTTVNSILSTVGPTAGTPVVATSNSGGTSDTLADVAEYYYKTDLRTATLGNCTSALGTTICTTPDPAPAVDPYNNVPSSGLDVASHQHMTTFTLGLGARGRMVFDPAYESATSGDFYSVKQGTTATTGVCTWQTSGACNWPTPGSDQIENIDDLWHAAVNGRGTYFSAANPTGLATALSNALAGVSARTGSAAAATTSNAFVTQGDNFLFRSTFVSQQWTGELIRQQLDVTSGAVLSAIDWHAQAKLDANTSRTVYFYKSGATNNLATFTLANLTAATLDGNFNLAHIASLSQLCGSGATCLAYWAANTPYAAGMEYRNGTTWYHVNTAYTSGATFGATDTTNASVVSGVAGVNLVAFLKGDRTYEGADTDTDYGKYYRQRNHVMGDIVSSESNYVKAALSPYYSDPHYGAYITSMADRQAMVYVGGNDGMLHAFYAADGMISSTTGHIVSTGGVNVMGGDEAWAFIPTAVMPDLYKLADKNYSNNHHYYVDGSPVTADICISNCTNTSTAVWKTILVGGLNSGGKSYYALDITNPTHPVALWQFTDANMGYTYGTPKIVKLRTGQWVALLTSGYNNTSGDGKGYLYVVDAYTGAPVTSINGTGIIGTGVGDTTTPSGLGKLDAVLTTPGVDATAEEVYAGDMLGNLWRFDINGDIGATGYDAQLLATLQGPSPANNVQPITTKPILSLVGTTLVIYVGTGRYLGSGDLADTSRQSFYAIKDTFPTGTTPGTAIYGNPRSGGFVQQTQTTTTCPVGTSASICTSGQSVVVSSNTAVSFSSSNGWFFDFPLAGERVNTDPAIIDGTLILNTNVPNASSCSVGGDSFQYQLNYRTGGSVSSSPTGVVAKKLGNELSTRPVVATLLDGTNRAYSQGSGGNTPNSSTVWSNAGGGGGSTLTGTPTRKSWRELIQQ